MVLGAVKDNPEYKGYIESCKMAFYGGAAVALTTFMNVPDEISEEELQKTVFGLADELKAFEESVNPERN
jgi:hypothetical protein